MKHIILVVFAVMLAGCAVGQVGPTPAQQEAFRQQHPAPFCTTHNQCEQMFYRARQFVIERSAFRLAQITPDYLETYQSTSWVDNGLSFRVQKVPDGQGNYWINAEIWCRSGQCNPWRALAEFNAFVAQRSVAIR